MSLLRFVRPPSDDDAREPGWRPINPDVDHFEPRGESLRDWPSDEAALYWWRPTYWSPGAP
ncbi:hypothetical protein ACFWQC_03865 [Nocardioides sp. NPDC058538]|uniref:hypothetical protein n=1 Tax=Nocardioides sp. NPDC058538 TaxID=3346542 RepID=UPI00364B5597